MRNNAQQTDVLEEGWLMTAASVTVPEQGVNLKNMT